MTNPIRFSDTGFAPPRGHPLGREGEGAAVAELIATVALAVCTLLAATAVSIGA